MTGISNVIEVFINDLIEQAEDGIVEIQRNEMAKHFDCAPSQINYVLSTRFTPYKGYYIESRRGGSGYIRIVKVGMKDNKNLNNIILNTIGNSITKNKAYHIVEALREGEIISEREELLIKATLGNHSLIGDSSEKNEMRANILKNILLVLTKLEAI